MTATDDLPTFTLSNDLALLDDRNREAYDLIAPHLPLQLGGFNPRLLGRHAGNASLIAIIRDETTDAVLDFEMRVMYGGLEEIYGTLTGKRFSTGLSEPTRGRWASALHVTISTGRPVVVSMHAVSQNRPLVGNGLSLPIFDGEKVVRICFVHRFLIAT